MRAKLILENGDVFIGKTLGHLVESTVAELVFNTSMSGVQEIMTDPSYYGQIVVMTYPLIGNYGFNPQDTESYSPKISGVVVREDCKFPSNFRCEMTLKNYLRCHKIPGLKGVDTRALTRVIREKGSMTAILTTKDLTQQQIRNLHKNYSNTSAMSEVSCYRAYDYNPKIQTPRYKIAIIDYGVKQSILENFARLNCQMRVFPFTSDSSEIAAWNPDVLFLSNGPGDPSVLGKKLGFLETFQGKIPFLGICLGHQLLALYFGGETSRLRYGHRGANHPVLDLMEDKILVTSQNHGFYVSKLPEFMIETHKNLIDQTNEGMLSEKFWIKSVQFHPESGPGPYDGLCLFSECLEFVDKFYMEKGSV